MIPLELRQLGAITMVLEVGSDTSVDLSPWVDPSGTPPCTPAFGSMLLGWGTR